MATAPTAEQTAAFNHEMQTEWGLAQGQFRIVSGPTSRYNCIASAIVANGIAARKLTPHTMARLDEMYALSGYYPIASTLPLQAGDVEVYTKPSAPGVPVHAHRVIQVAADANASTCRSKYGNDCLVEHPRTAFTRARSNGSYVYGTLARRYRYDAAQLEKDKEKIYTTKSGRAVKRKDLDTTTSGTIVRKTDIETTKTGTSKKRKTNSGAAASSTTSKPAASNTGRPATTSGHGAAASNTSRPSTHGTAAPASSRGASVTTPSSHTSAAASKTAGTGRGTK